MTDGPFKASKLPLKWKKFAECAANGAYSTEEMSPKAQCALEDDWKRGVDKRLEKYVKDIVCPLQLPLINDKDQIRTQLEAWDGETLKPLGRTYLDCVIQEVDEGRMGKGALINATYNALKDRLISSCRQIKEIALRDPKQDATGIMQRIESISAQIDLTSMAKRLVSGTSEQLRRPEKQDGLDDGVRL